MTDSYWVSPREANILITGRCNLTCRHCSVNSHGALRRDLPLSAWIEILDKLVSNKLIKLTVTGGEPLARPDFTDFIKEIAARPFRFSINTNATLITPSVIETVVKTSAHLNEFMISLDGPDQETVDAQRGRGVFGKLVTGVGKLRAAGLPFGFYCTVTSLNAHRLHQTAQLARALGGEWIKFNSFLLAGPGLNEAMIPSREQLEVSVAGLEAMKASHGSFIQGTVLDMRERACKFLRNEIPESSDRAYRCGGGTGRISVFPDGSVTPCDHLPEIILGNLASGESLQSILQGPAMKKFSTFLQRTRSSNPECSSCRYLPWCSGGCPVEGISAAAGTGKDRSSCLKLALENL
ncbi:hypothetical protein CSA37_04615 [Candidatus Fermentibacteria bacterium]|nr:MAG: hypothetical protein CSA37_06965 [Candidatus Fermentibacteria bacterium]PIE52931.1 MAG: hypothetical protein CSA37_04615 [Candidatus Fermentibacteria bacterium]